jgi:hypothetical protein
MELVVKICRGNREAGERVINYFQSELGSGTTRLDLILIKICGTMVRMGNDKNYIFQILDLDKGGTLDYHEFVDGIRYSLNIWVSQEEAEDLASFIDQSGTGQISIDEWNSRVDFEKYKALSETVTVTKAAFVAAFIEEYETEVLNDYYSLRKLVRTSNMSQE